MSGVKGKSGGKAVTLDEKQAKSRATAAREERRRQIAATKTAIGPPVTYGDLLKSIQCDGELLQNDRRAIEVERAAVELAKAQDDRDLARGKLLPADEARAAMRDLASVLLSHVPVITDAALALVPVEQQPGARLKLDAAVSEFRRRAEEAVKV